MTPQHGETCRTAQKTVAGAAQDHGVGTWTTTGRFDGGCVRGGRITVQRGTKNNVVDVTQGRIRVDVKQLSNEW